MNPKTDIYDNLQFWIELQMSWNGSVLENHLGYLSDVNKPKWNIIGLTFELKAPYDKYLKAVKTVNRFAEAYVKQYPIANSNVNSHSFVDELRKFLDAPLTLEER